jgi:hypothetical protein
MTVGLVSLNVGQGLALAAKTTSSAVSVWMNSRCAHIFVYDAHAIHPSVDSR